MRRLSGRAFGDLLDGLDMYSLLRSRVLSKGRYGRAREITVDLPEEVAERIHETIASQPGLWVEAAPTAFFLPKGVQ